MQVSLHPKIYSPEMGHKSSNIYSLAGTPHFFLLATWTSSPRTQFLVGGSLAPDFLTAFEGICWISLSAWCFLHFWCAHSTPRVYILQEFSTHGGHFFHITIKFTVSLVGLLFIALCFVYIWDIICLLSAALLLFCSFTRICIVILRASSWTYWYPHYIQFLLPNHLIRHKYL